ncbi:histidine kinase [Lactiplantibacillus herbarum]|uniref:histidine kinase n=1 Tax=Lactiplantibacillus herbarum TaxID=1670446 RepID=UPI001ED9A4BE|nr:histidine kinase [Lactiplantibacillus herbarum]
MMVETIVALGLLMGGLLSFESLELMMQRREQQTLRTIQQVREQYEQRQLPTLMVPTHA